MTVFYSGLIALLVILVAWWKRPRPNVSDQWLTDQVRRECAAGWDGPRWRLPKERK